MTRHSFILGILIVLLPVMAVYLFFAGISPTQAYDLGVSSSQFYETLNEGFSQLPPLAPGIILIGLKPGIMVDKNAQGIQISDASLEAALANLEVQNIEPVFPGAKGISLADSGAPGHNVNLNQVYRLRLAPDTDILGLVQELSGNPAIIYAEPDYLARLIITPNDPIYGGQWGLSKINAPAAWDVTTGSPNVVVAVVDAGIDAHHPDFGFSQQLWTNPGEIAGNSFDDDNNGYIDDLRGWNFVNNNADLSDNMGHGTQIAGVIAAQTNNGQGVAGVCWNCRLMIVKVMQSGGIANYSDIAAGIVYAAQKGARVINLSLGGSSDSVTLKAAIATAAKTAVIVGGAGNGNSSAPFYPAAYDDYVLATAGTTNSDAKVGTSNYGSWVDVSAPGEDIMTTFGGGTYGFTSGTSMAAPFAAGLAGLLRSLHPDWSPNMVRAQIIHTTDNIDGANPGYLGQLGSGRINAGKALITIPNPELNVVSYAVDGVTNGTVAPGSMVRLAITLRNTGGTTTGIGGLLSTSDPYVMINNAVASFGALDSYNTTTHTPAYSFSVSPSVPYGHPIPFFLTISAAGGFNTTLPLIITTQSSTIPVSGIINSDTAWTSDKTYLVVGNVLVSNGITLTIQPGTVVKFNPNTFLQIDGTLIADGAPGHEIIFTSAQATNPGGDWEGIKFTTSAVDASVDSNQNYISGSIFRYVRIEYSRGVELVDARPYFSRVTFYKDGRGMGLSGCDSAGALSWTVQTPRPGILVVHDSLFIENRGPGLTNYGSDYDIRRNQFLRNGEAWNGAVALCTNGSGEIISNIIKDNGGGISLNGDGVVADNFISGSIQFSNIWSPPSVQGLGLDIDGNPLVRHNVFANSGGAGLLEGCCSIINVKSGAPGVISNTFTGNWSDTVFLSASNATGTYQYNNLAGNRTRYIFMRSAPASQDITATLNYWGTTNTGVIDGLIYDYLDDFNPGQVFYQPLLASPEPSAPAFLWKATVAPDPVGIQQATFTLTFSAPMDQSINPILTFGAASPYTSYVVLNNGKWLSDSMWGATYDMTTLVSRGAYTISVSNARGLDGMEIPTDTRFYFTVDYAGQITDQTPPYAPSVFATGKPGDPSYVEAAWLARDSDSVITQYRYAIGSVPGATDIVNWTTVTAASFTRTGLGLIQDDQYWVAVQAQNIAGLWSPDGYSAFMAGQQSYRKVFLPLILKN